MRKVNLMEVGQSHAITDFWRENKVKVEWRAQLGEGARLVREV